MLRLLQPKVAVDEISSTLVSERAGPTLIENLGFGQVSKEEMLVEIRDAAANGLPRGANNGRHRS